MNAILIENVAKHVGQEVTLRGWLYNSRKSKKLVFLEIRDGSGIIQAVLFKGDVSEEQFETARHLTQESSCLVTGVVQEDSRSAIGYELAVKDLTVVQQAEEYPITPKEHGVAFLMEHRHLWLRSKRQVAILKIRAAIVSAIRGFFDGRGFTLVDSPVFTPSACEGTTTLFQTTYFSRTAYLTQSGQLYAEAACMALGRVYCFGPAFRAEKSKTRRHLTEFWMVEPEVAFMELDENMELAEAFICAVVGHVLERCKEELEILERDLSALEKVVPPFPRVSYKEAIQILSNKGIEITFGDDFGGDDETVLAKEFDRPVIVHRYPSASKAFYMKHDPEAPDVALCMDVLAPEGYGEIIGGGQREDDLEALKSRINDHDLPMEDFEWFLDLRRYGTVPHSGFGAGLERMVAWICGLHHVRETIPFPRLMDRLSP